MYENNVKLIGFVGHIDVYENEGKKPFAKVTLATNKNFGGKGESKPIWHHLRFFGNLAEIVKDRISKGSHLYVSGELDYDEWTSKNGDKQVIAVINVHKFIAFERPQKSDSNTEAWIAEYEKTEVK